MTTTTPAQAAGLRFFYAHPDDISAYGDVHYLRIYLASDVDALLQSKYRQITELVAALSKLTRIAEIESIDVDEYDALLAQHAAPPQADTTATAGNDDAVIAWWHDIGGRRWDKNTESDKHLLREQYAAHIREQPATRSEK